MVVVSFVLLTACASGSADAERAESLVSEARSMVDAGRYNAARMVLDSVAVQFPHEVLSRRAADRLNDSITYLESLRISSYSDSLLALMLPSLDSLIATFRYTKNEKYEDEGQYIAKSVNLADMNVRNCLVARVSDKRVVSVRSYVIAAKQLNHVSLTLRSGEDEISFTGSNYAFEAGGWHEILTLSEDAALSLLLFVSSHMTEAIRVTAKGEMNQVYHLTEQDKLALDDTYRLALRMKDVRTLEDNLQKANTFIAFYEQKILKTK